MNPRQVTVHGSVQGLVVGDYNQVKIVLPASANVPFLAPPKPAHQLIGRTELFDQLRLDMLSGRDSAIFALNGIPGVGKTAIAIALAHDPQVIAAYADGVLWAGLGPNPDLLTLLGQWAAALGIPSDQLGGAQTAAERARIIHAAIGLRRMLLVVDDAWDIQAALAFRLGGPNCAHLLTTRIPQVGARFAVNSLVIKELDVKSGLELLAWLAPAAVQADPDDARQLVEMVSGLPLALVLMGNYLRVQSGTGRPRRVREAIAQLKLAEQRLALSEPQGLLDAHPGLAAGVPMSLLASIEISDEALPPAGRQALRDISLFPAKPNTFGEEAGVAVVGGEPEHIDLLVEQGLLESAGADRYTLHQAIHDYATAHGPDPLARRRLVDYFVGQLAGAPDEVSAWDADAANILAALDVASDLDMRTELVRGVNLFVGYLRERGLFAQADTHLHRALSAAESLGDVAGQAFSLINLGNMAEREGNLAAAAELLQRGLALARGQHLTEPMGAALLRLGWVFGMSAKLPEANASFDEALDLLGDDGRPGARAAVLQGLGWLKGIHGEQSAAADLLRAAISAARDAADPHTVADVLQSLGWMEGMRGNLAAAQDAFTEAADLARSGDFRIIMVDALQGTGWLAGIRGDYRTARARFEEAIAVAESIAYRERTALLGNLGWVAREQGDLAGAHTAMEAALQLSRQAGDTEKVSLFLTKLGELEVLSDRLDDSERHLTEALDLARAHQFPDRLVDPLRTLGTIYRRRGDIEQALALLDEADAHARSLGNSFLMAEVENDRGMALLDGGDLDAAGASFSAAKTHATEAEAGDALGTALFGLAKVALARGDLAAAHERTARSLEVLSQASEALAQEVAAWQAALPALPA
jgi:tetratricopeptide (TPR) repeat protein